MHTLRQSYHTRICLDHFICTEKAIKFITGLEKLCQRSNLKVSQLCSQKVLIEWTAFIQGFPNQWPLKVLYRIACHQFIHTFRHRQRCQPRKATASLLGVRVRCRAQGHLDTKRGAEQATIQPTPPPEPHAGPVKTSLRKTSANCPHLPRTHLHMHQRGAVTER